MTLGAVSDSGSSVAVSFCSCCGAKMVPYFSEDAVVSKNEINQLISESFLTVKGAALFLPRGSSPTPNSSPPTSQRRNKHTGDLQKHLQTMFTVLRPEDTIRLAVRVESAYPQVTRYMVVVSTNGRQDTEESIVLGMDFVSSDSCCTVGLVLPLWTDTLIHLDGDGGFSVSTVNRVHVFKPVSVQAMWSALQSLHKACEVARCHNYYPGSLFLTWISYYQSRISSNQFCINEWNAMQDVESHRANSPVPFTDLPTERERTERLIKMRLREIMMQKDLENVTCKEIRTELEMQMVCNLREFKEFIDNEMIVILGQMDSPTEIFEHVYLGSEWNASNLEELQNSGVRYILNVTREIDNFFPGMFEYHNIRVWDEEATNLLEYWNETFKFISKAKKAGAKCLVHCKMGVSRSASTVIAYAMKEYGWDLDTAFDYVKERRAVTKPNPSFMKQLEEYQGILLASKQRHNKLWRSHSDSDLSDRSEPMCKPSSRLLGRSDSHNNNNNNTTTSSPSLHHFLGAAVLRALGTEPRDSAKSHAHTDGPCESAGRDRVGSDCGEPLPPPLPTPQAAIVVPEERPDNSASVAVTVPVARPHPPPSLHVLPPTPELRRLRPSPPTHLNISAPPDKPAELSFASREQSTSEDVSSLTLESTDSDAADRSPDLSGDRNDPLGPSTAGPHPLVLPLANSDDNNNPSEPPTMGGDCECRGDADGSSNHSADSIDFFSAREKFLGLAQDGRTPLEETQPRTPTPLEENGATFNKEDEEPGNQASLPSGDSDDRAPHHDNGVSVRHIVTEIEAICHPASCLPPSPSSPSSHSPHLVAAEPQEEEEEEGAEEGAESCECGPSSPASSRLQSPSSLPCDWPVGSVRRATEQLEQKLRQEMETAAQRSPLHSPGSEHPPAVRLSPVHPPPPPDPTEHGVTQGQSAPGSARTEDGEKQAGSRQQPQRLHSSSGQLSDPEPDPCSPPPDNSQVLGARPVTVHTSVDMLTSSSSSSSSSLASTRPLVEASLNTSSRSCQQSELPGQSPQCGILPQAPSNQMTVDGATVQASDTDDRPEVGPRGCTSPGCDAQSRLVRGSQELERIQQTLRELQAFLHEGISQETPEPEQPQAPREAMMDTEPGPPKTGGPHRTPTEPEEGRRLPNSREGKSFRELPGWHRAMELEARLRQAGLTPPSLMKRSASLAKLDRLELSANDLSDLDLGQHVRAAAAAAVVPPPSSHSQDSLSRPPSHPDDSWKKQKVFTLAEKTGRLSEDPSLLPASGGLSSEETGEREEPDGGGGGVSRQQGRGHSSRRSRKASVEKKQRAAAAAAATATAATATATAATALLYNTM